jgi:hypothetical protein
MRRPAKERAHIGLHRRAGRPPPDVTSKFFHQRLELRAQSRLLRGIVARIARRPVTRTPVVVFDLDGTLMDNRPRFVRILHELGDAWRDRHPAQAERCAAATSEGIVYGFVENLRQLGVDEPALHEEGFAFWKERFFADPHIKHDVEVPGARDYARACHEAGAIVVYLTGRDLPNMALGSFASLRDLGFPIGVIGTELVVKPTFDMPDTAFKQAVMPELARLGEVVAAFDNEPANTNLFLAAYPDCASIFLDTQHAPGPPDLDSRAQVIASFEAPAE